MPTLDFKGKSFVYAHHLSVPFRELEKWPRLFEQLSPIYKWTPGGL